MLLLKNLVSQISQSPLQVITLAFHSLSIQKCTNTMSNFLVPKLHNTSQNCGLKIKGRVRRRCKDCFMGMREGRVFVECKTYGRHRQISITKNPKNSWMLSHATQSKVRPW